MGSQVVSRIFARKARSALLCMLVTFPLCSFAAHEIGFLIDTSGSMKKNDPQNLRQPAVRLAAQMLPQNASAGIWLFDGDSSQLQPFGNVDQAWKDGSTQSSSKIHSRGQWTHLESAIRTASKAFSETAKSKSLIVLTDGRIDISKNPGVNEASRSRLLGEVLTAASDANIQIHTIALSSNTDQDLLQRLAIGSSGTYAMANTANDLMGIFLQAFDQAIASDQVPLEDNTFEVDQSIQEFTALIFRKPGSLGSELKTPGGNLLSPERPGPSKWYSDKLYDLVTVNNPEQGEWALVAELDPENRVTIVSDLEFNLRGLPNNIIQGQKVTLEFFLSDEDGPIAEPGLLSLLDIDFEQTIFLDPPKVLKAKVTSHNQGKVKTPATGIFQARLSKTLISGEHQFKVLVDGKTFQREQSMRARVFAQVFESSIAADNSTTEPALLVSLVPIKGLVDASTLDVTGNVKDADGKIQSVAVTKTKFGSWTLNVPPTAGKQVYKVFVTVAGKSATGDDFKLTQGPILVDYTTPLMAQEPPKQDLFDTLTAEGNVEEQQEIEQHNDPSTESLESEPPASSAETKASQEEKTPEEHALAEELPSDDALDDDPTDKELEDDKELTDEEDINQESEVLGEDENSNSMLFVYIGIGLVNTLLFTGGLVFVRRWFKKKQAQAAEEDHALLNEVNAAKANAEEKTKSEKPVKKEPIQELEDSSLTAEADKISDMLDNIGGSDELDSA